MGAGGSKQEGASQHVFSSGTPVQFSQELVDSLEMSAETNSSRAKTLELHIAARVAAELEKIQKRESETLASLRDRLSSDEPSPSSEETPSSEKSSSSLFEMPSLPSNPLTSSSSKSAEDGGKVADAAKSSAKVQEEIAKLKSALGARKKVTDLPKEVETAREQVIGCLRVNDRRPLDCWKEVEVFKSRVREMEDKFVGDIL